MTKPPLGPCDRREPLAMSSPQGFPSLRTPCRDEVPAPQNPPCSPSLFFKSGTHLRMGPASPRPTDRQPAPALPMGQLQGEGGRLAPPGGGILFGHLPPTAAGGHDPPCSGGAGPGAR